MSLVHISITFHVYRPLCFTTFHAVQKHRNLIDGCHYTIYTHYYMFLACLCIILTSKVSCTTWGMLLAGYCLFVYAACLSLPCLRLWGHSLTSACAKIHPHTVWSLSNSLFGHCIHEWPCTYLNCIGFLKCDFRRLA